MVTIIREYINDNNNNNNILTIPYTINYPYARPYETESQRDSILNVVQSQIVLLRFSKLVHYTVLSRVEQYGLKSLFRPIIQSEFGRQHNNQL